MCACVGLWAQHQTALSCVVLHSAFGPSLFFSHMPDHPQQTPLTTARFLLRFNLLS